MILDISRFDVMDNLLFYEGNEAHYSVRKEEPGFSGYVLVVEKLDENGDAYTAGSYACSTLSVAITSIESLENGEEI